MNDKVRYLTLAIGVAAVAPLLFVQDLSAQALDLSSFGAKCDGSTDDTGALTSAIQAASSRRAVLVVGSGTCLQKQVEIAAPITIRIVNGAVLKLVAGANSKQFLIRASNVTLSGDETGIIDGNSGGQSQPSDQIMIDPGVSDVAIEHIRFKNTRGSHIRSKGATGPLNSHITITHDTFENAAGSAVFLNWETADSTIDDNTFLGGRGNAISVYNNSPRAHIQNNRISNYDRMAIEVWNGGAGAVVENNTIKLSSTARPWGISMDRSPNSIVKNNQITCSTENGFDGIEIVGSDNSQVASNTISGFATGISIDRSSNVKATGNTINSTNPAGPSVSGIFIGSSVAGQHIHGNWIEGNKITLRGPGKGAGIRLMCNANNTDCSENTIVDNHFVGEDGPGAYAGVSMARYGGAEEKTVIALNRFASIAKPFDPEAGTKARLLSNRGEQPAPGASGTAQAASGAQSEAAGEENDDRAGRLTLANGQASYQFERTYSKPPECIAVDKANRKRLASKTTTTTLTVTGPSGASALYVCHGE
jgi:parallel beta-helix repeat protein